MSRPISGGETYAGGGDELRGDNGPLQVEEVRHRDTTNDAVLAGFRDLGVPMNLGSGPIDVRGAI